MNELGEHDVIEHDMGLHHKDKHDLGDAEYGTFVLLVGAKWLRQGQCSELCPRGFER